MNTCWSTRSSNAPRCLDCCSCAPSPDVLAVAAAHREDCSRPYPAGSAAQLTDLRGAALEALHQAATLGVSGGMEARPEPWKAGGVDVHASQHGRRVELPELAIQLLDQSSPPRTEGHGGTIRAVRERSRNVRAARTRRGSSPGE